MRQAPSAPYASLISHSHLQEKSAATAREVARTIYEGDRGRDETLVMHVLQHDVCAQDRQRVQKTDAVLVVASKDPIRDGRIRSDGWALRFGVLDIWPITPLCDELHHVVLVGTVVVVFIACTEDFVNGWHLERSENSQAWAALMTRFAAPDVMTDGESGFGKARRVAWSNTRVQSCVFHAFEQVKLCTIIRPKLQAVIGCAISYQAPL